MTTRTIAAVLLGLVCFIGIYSHGNSLEKPLKVRAIYPAGEEVATSDRITIEFNQNVVSLGASMFVDDVVPVDIEPAVECEWNWVKLNMLQCELPVDSNLRDATRYKVTVRPGIKSPHGQVMDEDYVHIFETILPTILYSTLVSWSSPTQPIVEVSFNQRVNLDSLKDRLLLWDSVSGKEIPTKICPSNWRLRSAFRDDYFGRKQTHQRFDQSDCDVNGVKRDEVLILPLQPLSPNSTVSILLLPGVESATGNLTSRERVLFDTKVSTFDDFRLLGLFCQDVQGKDVLIPAGESNDVVCRMSSSFALVFSSRFRQQDINDFVHTQPQTKRQDRRMFYRNYHHQTLSEFNYRIRHTFEPNTTYRLFVAPSTELSDESTSVPPLLDGFGRPLVGGNEITVRTGRAPPLTFVDQSNIVVHSDGPFDPIFFLQNVEDVSINYDLLDEEGISRQQIRTVQRSNEEDVWQRHNLGLRTSLRSPSGVMYGKIVSHPRFDRPEKQISDYFFAQATPYSVFLKLGTVSSLAWVVNLQTGEPIADAEVDFYTGTPNDFADIRNSIFSGLTNKDGLVVLPGYEAFDPQWDQADDNMRRDCAGESDCTIYFLRVSGEAGLALLPLDRDYVLTGRAGSIYENVDHWATTSQNLYMPGDTVHIKGYVRTSRDEIRTIPKEGNFALCAYGPDGREYEIGTISLNQFGAYQTSLELNDRTEFGSYGLVLIYDPIRPITDACSHSYDGRWPMTEGIYVASGGSFKVHEFKTNPIRVSLDLNANEFERGDSMTIYTSATFHVGGPYANASGQVVVNLWADDPPFETVQALDYVFSRNPEVKFNEHVADINLNDNGKNTAVIEALDSDIYYGNFEIESSIISDRGKSVATRTTASYYGVDEFVGIRRPTIYRSFSRYSGRIKFNEPWPIQVLVLTKDDEVVKGKKVQISVLARDVDLEYQQYKWLETIFQCEIVSGSSSTACEFTPPLPISYVIEAQITDTKGNTHLSSMIVDAIVAEPRPTIVDRQARLELICDSQHVDVGDMVDCEVNNYLGTGPLLVTIERAGVVDQWLVQPDPKNPIIEFNVLDNYAPHFELSVLTVSPRSPTHVRHEPLYQMAKAKFTMDNPRLIPLEIKISSNRESYSPRNEVTLSISTEQRNSRDAPIEYAIAVVDEALVDLSGVGDEYFDPTKKLWKFRDHGILTFGLIASLMEKPVARSRSQDSGLNFNLVDMENVISTGTYMPVSDPTAHTENKGKLDPNVRTIDRFVAYWNPSVVTSKKRVKLNFRLPDNLTSWRVLVLAVSADDRFGFATTTFSSVKDTEIRAVAPNVVIEGDSFQVGASILNRADRHRSLKVELQVTGSLVEDSKTTYERQLDFAPFERKLVTWDVEAGRLPQSLDLQQSIKTSEIQVVARAGDRRDNDGLDIRIPVRSSRVRVSSVVYGALNGDKTTIPIAIPNKVADDNGQLDFTLTTNKAVNFDGVFRYAIEYPYSCWEQELTQAILAMQYVQLEKRGTKHGIQWSDPEGLIARVLTSAVDFQSPNGGMAYFIPRDENADPYLSAYTAIAFSWLEDAGYEVHQGVKRKLVKHLQKLLNNEREVLTSSFYESDATLRSQLRATVGAVVVHALAVSGELKETELIQYSDQINQMDLFGLSQYLMASLKLDPTHSLSAKIFERIMNHRSLVDGAIEFVESVPGGFTRILHSDTRSLCSVLEALTKMSETSSKGVEIGELNELSNAVRYARDNLPYWHNTQDNVFCTNALISFFDYIDSDIGNLLATVDLRSDETGLSTRLAEGWHFSSNITQLHTQHSLQSQLFGAHGAIEINRQGSGNAFYNVELSYLTTVDESINRFSGFEIHREYVALRDKKWQILKPGDHINKSEYVLVNLYLNNRFDRHHVVIDDSVPGGLEPVNKNLGTEFVPPYDRSELAEILSTSKLFREFEEASFRSFRYRELGLQDVRFFAKSIRRGRYHLAWLGQAISAGEFTVLPTHVEEMYRPIMFGKSEPWTLTVKERSQSALE